MSTGKRVTLNGICSRHRCLGFSYEAGGLEGSRLAREFGVQTLPTMMLIDPSGKVVRHNVRTAELQVELERIRQGGKWTPMPNAAVCLCRFSCVAAVVGHQGRSRCEGEIGAVVGRSCLLLGSRSDCAAFKSWCGLRRGIQPASGAGATPHLPCPPQAGWRASSWLKFYLPLRPSVQVLSGHVCRDWLRFSEALWHSCHGLVGALFFAFRLKPYWQRLSRMHREICSCRSPLSPWKPAVLKFRKGSACRLHARWFCVN